MSTPIAMLLVSTMVGVLAAVLLSSDDPPPRPRRDVVSPGIAARLCAAILATAIIVATSGWLLPGIVVGAIAWCVVGAAQQRDRRPSAELERTDALASWIENLRDVLIAGDQPIGAITATVPTCPPSIRPQVRRLAASLGRQDPELAFGRFADEIDDPLGDLVAAGLLVAVRRGARTVAVLSALAEQARQQADRRRLVEAERAPVQREVRLLGLVMGGLIAALLLFGRADYLEPYGTPSGQVFLCVVLALYGVLLLRVQRLARHPRPERFLTAGGAR